MNLFVIMNCLYSNEARSPSLSRQLAGLASDHWNFLQGECHLCKIHLDPNNYFKIAEGKYVDIEQLQGARQQFVYIFDNELVAPEGQLDIRKLPDFNDFNKLYIYSSEFKI